MFCLRAGLATCMDATGSLPHNGCSAGICPLNQRDVSLVLSRATTPPFRAFAAFLLRACLAAAAVALLLEGRFHYYLCNDHTMNNAFSLPLACLWLKVRWGGTPWRA